MQSFFDFFNPYEEILQNIEFGNLSVLLFLLIAVLLYMVVVALTMITRKRNSAELYAWLIIILIAPFIGFVLYLLFGRDKRKHISLEQRQTAKLQQIISENQPQLFEREKELIAGLGRDEFWHYTSVLHLLKNNSFSLLSDTNDIEVFYHGSQKMPRLLEDISNAKKSIYVEYYTLHLDDVTKPFFDLLITKAEDGLEVKILADGFGSFGMFLFQRGIIRRMRKAGITIEFFNLIFRPQNIINANYRSHRKIVAIDGIIGYTGGMNMKKEYYVNSKKLGYWEDTHLRIEGPAVYPLQSIVLTSIARITNTPYKKPETIDYSTQAPKKGTSVIQLVSSGPDSEWTSLQQMIISMVLNATKSIYIQSPYFIPDQSIISALKIAALSGIDVRVMITGIPDKKLPYWAALSYLDEMISAGVKMYQYRQGFMHSKMIVVDEHIATIGTTNLDNRSLHINYELNPVFYDRAIATTLKQHFLEDLEFCHEPDLEEVRSWNILVKFRNGLASLFSPLL